MKRALFVFIVIFISSLFLTACGGGGIPVSTKIDVLLSDFHFTPDTFVVPAGQQITLNASNTGAVLHEFVIMDYGKTIGDDFGDEDRINVYWELELEPQKSTTIAFPAPTEPGEYQIICGTEGHFKAGMIGKLIVVKP